MTSTNSIKFGVMCLMFVACLLPINGQAPEDLAAKAACATEKHACWCNNIPQEPQGVCYHPLTITGTDDFDDAYCTSPPWNCEAVKDETAPANVEESSGEASILGGCGVYAVHAGTTATFDGVVTTINSGIVGVSPGTAVTGKWTMNGERDAAAAKECEASRNELFTDISGRTCPNTIATDLTGQTLKAGVYCQGTFSISAGEVTLDGEGNADATWVFQTKTTLVTAASTRMKLVNGAQAKNVYWAIGSSATLGASSDFVGQLVAAVSITVGTSANVDGRLLAAAAVTCASGATIAASAVTVSTPTVERAPNSVEATAESIKFKMTQSCSDGGDGADCAADSTLTVYTNAEGMRQPVVFNVFTSCDGNTPGSESCTCTGDVWKADGGNIRTGSGLMKGQDLSGNSNAQTGGCGACPTAPGLCLCTFGKQGTVCREFEDESAAGPGPGPQAQAATQVTDQFNACAKFKVHAGTTITFDGTTTDVGGRVGVSPGTAITGSYTPVTPPQRGDDSDRKCADAKMSVFEVLHGDGNPHGACDPGALKAAAMHADAPSGRRVPGDLAGKVFTPGVYCASSMTVSAGGKVYLDAGADKDAVWVFQTTYTLITAANTEFIMIGEGRVYWAIGSSITLGAAPSSFVGSAVADVSITVGAGANVDGRLLAKAAVTFASGATFGKAAAFSSDSALTQGTAQPLPIVLPVNAAMSSSPASALVMVIVALGVAAQLW